MKTSLIIGAGQLGSRHIQGLLKLTQKQVIYVLDPSNDSLSIAKQRAEEVPHNHSIIFRSSWDNLPLKFDLVIVATGANVREKIVTQLLNGFVVKNMILEKILFQELESYHRIEELLKKTNISTWVNHPRRMANYYQEIKNNISETNERVSINVIGGSWGLACNGLHFIDLCAFLSNSSVESLNTDWVDPIVIDSKRKGCIEFTGSLSGVLKNKSNFVITSLDSDLSDVTVFISTNSNRWIVQEAGAQKIIHLSKENGFNEVVTKFVTEFQSTLTTRVADNIFELGTCNLPTYEEASNSHIPFIEAALKLYNKTTDVKTNICPIT